MTRIILHYCLLGTETAVAYPYRDGIIEALNTSYQFLLTVYDP
jgi:hypothetical protein